MDFRENSNRNIGTYSDHLALCYAIICGGELLPTVGGRQDL